MKVYHGSKSIVKSPDVSFGRDNLDFGKGFYTTDLREQAEKWVQHFLNLGNRAFINCYDFEKDSALKEFRYKHFDSYNEDWLNFVLSNRNGGKDFLQFDIVEGGIANDKVFNTLELYLDGLIDKAEALKRLRFERPNNQICILNQSVIEKYFRFLRADEVRL